jgi:integrase
MTPIDWVAFSARIEKRYKARRCAPSTLIKVRQILKEVGEFVASPAQLGDEAINDWIISRPARAAISFNGMLGLLRKIAKLAVGWGYLDRSPFDAESYRLKVPKVAKKRHLSLVELAKLFDHLEQHHRDSWQDGRLYTLAMLIGHTGLRAKEGLRLMVEDLDMRTERLTIVAREARLKTVASETTIPIPPAALPSLESWLPRCGSVWLFPGTRRTGPWVHGSNSRRPADFLDAAGQAAGLAPGTTLLMLRHSLATHGCTRFGMSPKEMQQFLRHANIATQEHYIERDLDNLRAAVLPIDFRGNIAPRHVPNMAPTLSIVGA